MISDEQSPPPSPEQSAGVFPPLAERRSARHVANRAFMAIKAQRAADRTPIVARVEAGEHLVTVLGAGDTYLPSQISVVVESSDTAAAVFSTPEALQRMRELKRQQTAAKAAQQASPDSAAPDSAAAPPR